MKNVQVIDGATNCTYEIFQINEEDFKVIFPNNDQEIQFADELDFKDARVRNALDRMWQNRIDRRTVVGIHGTLFYQLEEKKIYFPTRKWAEAVALPLG